MKLQRPAHGGPCSRDCALLRNPRKRSSMLHALVWMHGRAAHSCAPSPCGRLVAPLWGRSRGELNRACCTRSSITASRVPPISDAGYYGSLRAALRLLKEARIMGLRYLALAAISAVLLSLAHGTWTSLSAQERFPAHPVHLIVPAPAGGSLDIGIRIIEPRLSALLGAPIVIVNRSGASGAVAMAAVASAPADGYTLAATSTST